MYAAVINTPIGKLGIQTILETVANIDFLAADFALIEPKNSHASRVTQQLTQYFQDSNFQFDAAFSLHGTPFQQRVWQALQAIPVGTTLSYGELARQLNTSARAVGNACRRNPIPIIIPCHRIIAASHLGGFSGKVQGEMLSIKSWLLQHEQRYL